MDCFAEPPCGTQTEESLPISTTVTLNGTQILHTSAVYDANGNELRKTETVPTADGKDSTSRLLRRNLYDLRNCLILTETPENLVESVYNAEGLWVKKTVTANTISIYFLLSTQDRAAKTASKAISTSIVSIRASTIENLVCILSIT